ncbi:ANK_REP_REGION domain-containing protein [Burkholderia cenocepacia]|uniref:ankyrin repeat domain-containing protein n=1 Tax=Burkholderia cenocepacia TaxID=95486 RepID=UPI00192CB37B|nr:ankyrin repeat domain-containing protein [Burkholderia cenocepacia]CAD9227909.1 ANK_REP_REGION domain-containing protein [Burkholderia cenocepacia]
MAFYMEEQTKLFIKSLVQGDLEQVKHFVENEGFHPDKPIATFEGITAGSPLVEASNAKNGVEVVKYLIEKGADVTATHNQDALKQASYWGNNDTVNVLLDAGMDIHYNDEQALRASLVDNQKDTSQLLLSRKANADVAIERIANDNLDPLKGSILLQREELQAVIWLRDTADKINLKNKLEAETSSKNDFKSIMQGLGQHTAQQQSTKKIKI